MTGVSLPVRMQNWKMECERVALRIARCALVLLFTVYGEIAQADTNFGAIETRYEKIAGPVKIQGSYPDARVHLNDQVLIEDREMESISIVAAFPDWQSPATVVLHFSPGGRICGGSYSVLDVASGRYTERFGNCGPATIRETAGGLVFSFPDDPVDSGLTYRNGNLAKIAPLSAEQHARFGLAAYASKNFAKAIEHLWLVRSTNAPEVTYHLGLMAHLGQGVRQDYAVAMSLYKHAADIAYPPALFRIGVLYANGRGVPKNVVESVRWYMRAAEQNDALAQYNVALAFLTGNGLPKDPRRALLWMLLAKERLTDPKLVSAAEKNILLSERQLDDANRSQVRAEASSWKPASEKLAFEPSQLKEWVGKYPFDRVRGLTFLEQPEIQLRIALALGAEALTIIKGMGTVPPIKESNGWVVASGCQPHMCIDGNWTVAVNLTSLELRACLAEVSSKNVRLGNSNKRLVELSRATLEGCPGVENILELFERAFAPSKAIAAAPAPPNQTRPEATRPSKTSSGSGFIINSEGYILTNNHVVEDCSAIKVQNGAQTGVAAKIASDAKNDLAILKAPIRDAKPLFFRDGSRIRRADTVLAIGFPYNGLLSTEPNVAIGAVSALAGIGDDTRFLQISAPIQPGNSGGPLLDTSGNVVGVIVATMNALTVLKVTGSVPQNVNFAIKSDIARVFLETKGIVFSSVASKEKLDMADVGEKGSRAAALVICEK